MGKQRALLVNHLLFAYDSLLFCKASVAENRRVHQILNKYAKALGQIINHEKTSMSFNKNIPSNIQEIVLEIWGANGRNLHDNIQAFMEIKTKVWQKLQC